jgi:hypothetical protein
LATSTAKKVLIRRFDREPLSGFVSYNSYLTESGLEFLNLSGSVSIVPYAEIKSVHFVREFDRPSSQPELREFRARPKMDGLWIRAQFHDGDYLEGVMQNNLLQLETQGFTFTPPDYTYNNQRVFVPKSALVTVQVLGVVGSPAKRRKAQPTKDQIRLFE